MCNGKQGEQLFARLAQENGYEIVDVSGNPNYWDKDIDFLVTNPTTNNTKTFEVKYDSRIGTTGNMYLEISCINSKQGKGWWRFCKADFLVYGDSNSNKFYIFNMEKLRERVRKLNCRLAYCGYGSTGILVSLLDVSDLAVMMEGQL